MESTLSIIIKLREQQTIALMGLHLWLLAHFEPENPHEDVQHQYLACLYEQLVKKRNAYDRLRLARETKRGTKTWRLIMTPYEALLFCQMWGPVCVDHDPLGKLVLYDIIAKIQKRIQRPAFVPARR